jgi:hypothetical protein
MTGMDKIAEALFEALNTANDAELESLSKAMAAYAARYDRSLRDLNKVPGFAKLWMRWSKAFQFGSAKLRYVWE